MDIYTENNFHNLTIYQKKWNKLCEQNLTNTIFQTYEWIKTWWSVHKGDNKLFVVLAMEGKDLVGIAPMMIMQEHKWAKKRRVLKFISSDASDYADFIIQNNRGDVLTALITYILNNIDKWDRIELLNIPEYSQSGKTLLDIFEQRKFKQFIIRNKACPALNIKDDADFAKKAANKKSLRRHHTYFRKQGEFEVLHLFDQSQIKKYLRSFFDQHIERWKRSNAPSLFEDKTNRLFYEELTRELSCKGWLAFTVIKSKGIQIAYHFGFDYNNKFIWYKPSFDISLSKHSPGEVLLKELLEYAIKSKKDEFDFTVGKESYKSRFSNKIGKNYDFHVFKYKSEFITCCIINAVKQMMMLRFKSMFRNNMFLQENKGN